MSKYTLDLHSLTPEQVAILDTWYTIDGTNLHRLLSIINKTSLICHMDERYHLSPDDASTLITFSDLVAALINSTK